MADIESFLREKRVFAPAATFAKQANWGPKKTAELRRLAARSPERFWEKMAKEHVSWFKPWRKTLDWKPPFAKWFVGGQTNVSYNCLDRHLAGENAWRRNKAALIWEGEPGDSRVLTYGDLHREVCKFANVLKAEGVKKGDRVAIYMPMIPEIAIAMLACTRIGAIHTVVFGGFSADALRDRILDLGAKLVVTADGGWRRGKVIELKDAVDEAVAGAKGVERVIVVRRTGEPVPMKAGRDLWWHDLMADAPADCAPAKLDAEHPLFVLYTSGSTGKPKGILHTTGGYLTHVAATSHAVFDLKDEDTFWCTADVGWVTGHSYVLYGPLANGATTVMYEGAPNQPGSGPVLGDHREVSGQHLLHRADRDPNLHPLGRRASESARSLLAAPARHGGRADQSRSVDLVSPRHRQEALPDRRHLVADRDRGDPDHSAPGRSRHQAGIVHRPVPRNHARDPRRRGPAGEAGTGRLPHAPEAVAGDAPRDLGRSRPLPGAVLEPLPERVLHRRRRPAR